MLLQPDDDSDAVASGRAPDATGGDSRQRFVPDGYRRMAGTASQHVGSFLRRSREMWRSWADSSEPETPPADNEHDSAPAPQTPSTDLVVANAAPIEAQEDEQPAEEPLVGLPGKAYIAFVCGCFGLAGASYAIAPNLSLTQLAQDTAATGATLACMYLITQACIWLAKGYLDDESFRAKVVPFSIARFSSLAAIAAVGFAAPAMIEISIGAMIVMLVLTRCSVVFERHSKRKIQKLRTNSTARRTNSWIKVRISKTQISVAIRLPVGKAARREIEAYNKLRTSHHVRQLRAHVSITALLVATIFACALGTAAAMLVSATDKEPSSSGTQSQTTSTESHPAAPPPTTPTIQATPTGITQAESPPSWDGICPARTPLGEATPQAYKALTGLYAKLTLLSPQEKGCMGAIYRHMFDGTVYFTVTGIDPITRVPLTYGIDSESFGPVLFLASAAQAVEALISDVGPIGGVGRFPYYGAGAGSYYLIRTHDGVYALVRRRPTEDYLLLTPTVVRAWLGAMNEEKAWLWPTVATYGSSTQEAFLLRSDDRSEQVEATINLDAHSGEAKRSGYRYLVHRKGKKEVEPGLSEITELAKKA